MRLIVLLNFQSASWLTVELKLEIELTLFPNQCLFISLAVSVLRRWQAVLICTVIMAFFLSYHFLNLL